MRPPGEKGGAKGGSVGEEECVGREGGDQLIHGAGVEIRRLVRGGEMYGRDLESS